ncbi:MAG: Cytidylate kinaselike [Candidatus Saccharibacteria bacterium]|nr:Cytidylate kinaselike [Candidatus Saccharibacteria bacterium]
MREPRPNIAFAGLTAAGKTTHAKLLAEDLGYEYVSATEIILELTGLKGDPNKAWLNNYDQIEKAREGDGIDIELERRVTDLASSKDGLILDTWAMAYIFKGPLIRIWLESDRVSRARKCYVSQGEEKARDIDACEELVARKDTETRDKFQNRLKFDLFTDMTRYDAIIDNTRFIPQATDAISKEGIRQFRPVVLDVAAYLIETATSPQGGIEQNPAELSDRHGPMVHYVCDRPWSF